MSGGDSGGSHGRNEDEKAAAAATAAAATPATSGTMTINPFFGNNQSSLAQQLAMGFGGTPESYLQSALMQLFQPMTVPDPVARAQEAAAASDSGDSKKKKSSSNDELLERIRQDGLANPHRGHLP